ncbi:hypothetical protein MKX01_030182 [Papaver californicum]|nr:hypothetical protein MKX01_030182 [Papaver californicum]
MKGVSVGLIIGVSVGVVIGAFLAIATLFCVKYRRKHSQIVNSSSRRGVRIPIRTNGADSCTILSDSTMGPESPKTSDANSRSCWIESSNKKSVVSMSGIPKYPYKELQKATYNFTTMISHGAFGPVYKARMGTGETVAVKMLATNSKQGEKEFQSEVSLLGTLHHRNLVNLVGYCAEKGQLMLVYVCMSNGSLASHLYSDKHEPLSWDLRIYIALDVAKGLEYLHDGAVPPVVHRDIKSSNILLDRSMRARGTFGYLDPEYISSRAFTKKSDVYSFGVLLFELVAGRNPQQGLMELVDLAAMNTEGKVGWEEIVDSRLDGKFDTEQLNDVAALAYKCVNRLSKKRPAMRDIVQALCGAINVKQSKNTLARGISNTDEEVAIEMPPLDQTETNIAITELRRQESQNSISSYRRQESQTSINELRRQESVNSSVDLPEV